MGELWRSKFWVYAVPGCSCKYSCHLTQGPSVSKSPSTTLISLRLKMSASPIARQAIQPQGQAIPRRIQINDASQLPHDYSSTPGGTLYSTTPGGTRIIYDRTFLLQMRNSPIARTPPTNLPVIPGVTCDAKPKLPSAHKTSPSGPKQGESSEVEKVEEKKQDEPQFEMDT